MDPRIVKDIMSSPAMYREQGGTLMADFGGPTTYLAMSEMSMPERVTYGAVLDGYSSTEEIVDMTGLNTKEVNAAVSSLTKKGYVNLA